MSSLYATVQTVAQKIKNLIALRMSVRKGTGVLQLVRGWGLGVEGCSPDEGTFKSEKHIFALL